MRDEEGRNDYAMRNEKIVFLIYEHSAIVCIEKSSWAAALLCRLAAQLIMIVVSSAMKLQLEI